MSEESPGRRLTYLTGVRTRPSTMCSRHTPEGVVAWHHNSSHTVEFSSNRRPDQSNQNFHSDRLRPGVVGSCFFVLYFFVFLVLLASELISSSASHLIGVFSNFLEFAGPDIRSAFAISDP